MKKVVIIGAGPTGLATAYRLAEKGGMDITVLESSSVVGGLTKSLHHKGFIVDIGPHQVHTKDENIIQFLKDLLQEDFLTNTKKASHFYLGKFYNYPLQIKNVLMGLPLRVSFGCFWGFLKQSVHNCFVKNTHKDANFETWVINHFGPKMYHIYFGPYTQKVWGKPPKELHAICAKERIAVQNLWDVVLSAIWKKVSHFRNHYHLPHSPYQSTFHYPRFGYGEITERMAKYVEHHKGRIVLNAGAQKIVYQNNQYEVHSANGQHFVADIVVSTIPVHLLKNMLEHPDTPATKPAENLEFRSLTFVYLLLNREHVTDNHWIYFPDTDYPFQRSSEFRNFTPTLCPEGQSSICLEIPCDFGDNIWKMSDQELYEFILPKATERYLKKEWITGYFVARERYAYPTYTTTYADHLDKIQQYLGCFPNLYSVGRHGSFKYVNIDQVLAMGFKTADTIISSL